jgi:hypothetical protein
MFTIWQSYGLIRDSLGMTYTLIYFNSYTLIYFNSYNLIFEVSISQNFPASESMWLVGPNPRISESVGQG